MVESIKQFFVNTFTNPFVATLLIAILPIIELRGAIPFGYYLFIKQGFSNAAGIVSSAAMGFLGSSLVAPIVLLLLIPILNWLKKTKLFRKPANWMEQRFTKKSEKLKEKAVLKASEKLGDVSLMTEEEKRAAEVKVDKRIFWSKFLGVMTFVAIPLPFTGVWTGSAVAAFLKMKFRWGLLAVILGNLIAGTIITLVTLGVGTAWLG